MADRRPPNPEDSRIWPFVDPPQVMEFEPRLFATAIGFEFLYLPLGFITGNAISLLNGA